MCWSKVPERISEDFLCITVASLEITRYSFAETLKLLFCASRQFPGILLHPA